MSWEAIAAVGEITGALAVVVSLIYLAAQIRQNTRSNAASANQDLLTGYLALVGSTWQNEFSARLYQSSMAGSWDQLSADEQAAARQLWLSAMRIFEHAFLQRRAGLLSDDAWGGWKTQIYLSSVTPGFRTTWPAWGSLLNPSFVGWVNGFGDEALVVAERYQTAMAGGGMQIVAFADATAEEG